MSIETKGRLIVTATVLLVLLSTSTFAQSETGYEHRQATVTRPSDGLALSTPSSASPMTIVTDYLRAHGVNESTLNSLREVSTNRTAQGILHVRLEQQFGGLDAYGSYVKAAINSRGELVHLIENLAYAPAATPRAPAISALQALQAAIARVHPKEQFEFMPSTQSGNTTTFSGGAFFHDDPSATRVAIPMADGSITIGFLVETWSEAKNLLHHTLVGGDGRVLDVELRTASDTYNVFTEDPLKTPQAVVNGPGNGNDASPAGWLAGRKQLTTKINGNNALAYLDTNTDNRPDSGGSAVNDGNFITLANLGVAPSTTENRAVAVQNLFYLNNIVHDILFRNGFDEAAGNFQQKNFGNGGKARDAVQAEAQDGGGTDNANFATPPDGKKPRMQMYLWNGFGPTHEVEVAGGSTYSAMGAAFGPTLDTTGLTGEVVLANDGSGTTSDACEAVSGTVAGKIALVDRGTCTFVSKALNVQTAGATGMIVANNVGGNDIIGMASTDPSVTIPAVMISQNDGAALRALSAPTATMRIKDLQQLDASLDSDIVFHEYGHGLTWRMIGGMSGPLAGAIGEGMSDGVSMLINGDDRIGEYSARIPLGIRSAPYTNYSRTYANVTGSEVHYDGEVYAAIVWKLIQDFDATARRDVLFGYLVDGMNYTPSTPAYEDMRDGILAAVGNGPNPSDCSLIWQAFATYGVGVGAQGVVNGNGTVTITPSFTAGTTCN